MEAQDDSDDDAAPDRSEAAVREDVGDVIKNGRSRIDLSKIAAEEEDGSSSVEYIYTDNNTLFVLNSMYDSRTKFTVYTGYNEAPDVQVTDQSVLAAYVNSKGIVKAVFVTTADITGSNDIIFVVGADNVKLNGTGSNRYYVYDAVVKGEATTIDVRYGSSAAASVSSLKKGDIGIFFGMTTSDGYVTRLNENVPNGVRVNGKSSEWTPYRGTQRLTEGVYGFGYDGENSYEFHSGQRHCGWHQDGLCQGQLHFYHRGRWKARYKRLPPGLCPGGSFFSAEGDVAEARSAQIGVGIIRDA